MTIRADAERADRVIREAELDARTTARVVFKHPDQVSRAMLALDDDHIDSDAERLRRLRAALDPGDLDNLQLMLGSGGDLLHQLVLDRWARHRIAFTFDPDTTEALVDTFQSGDTTKIPGSILRQIPYPDPFLLFPEPIQQVNGDGKTEEYRGVLLRGSRTNQGGRTTAVSLTDPEADALSLTFLGYLIDEGGRPIIERVPMLHRPGTTLTRRAFFRLDVNTALTGEQSVAQRVEAALHRMFTARPAHEQHYEDENHAKQAVTELLTLGLSLLVYLVTDNADRGTTISPRSRPANRRHRRTTQQGNDITVVPMGYRIGHALRTAHATTDIRDPHPETGRTVRPHMRRAHPHLFWRGPRTGPREQVLHWLPPIAVKGDYEPPAVTTVHRAN